VVPTYYPLDQQLTDWVKYLHHISRKLFTRGTSTDKLEKAMELAELGFCKKKNEFEGAYDVIDFSITRPLIICLETTGRSSIMQMTR
jgi:hypothetical protein